MLGSDNGFVSFTGLIWLKLLPDRLKDESDVVELAVRRMEDVLATRKKLPPEFHKRFDALIVKAKFQIETDPYNPAND